MKDSICRERLQSLQSYLNNLMLLSDTTQREVLLKCLDKARKNIKNGQPIVFQKEIATLGVEILVG